MYAHESIYEPLVRRVNQLVGELRQGDPAKDFVDLGAIIFPKQIEVAEKLISDAVAKGAELVCGGKKKEGAGQFFEPTVLANCNHAMNVMREEIFGPIVAMQKVSSEDEALRLANESHLGLNAYVFTRDRAKGKALAERVEAGSVVVNDIFVNYAAAEAPFGGVKQSGFGRIHGEDALREMAEMRHVNVDRFPLPHNNPMAFPYTAKSYGALSKALRVLFSGRGIVQRISELF